MPLRECDLIFPELSTDFSTTLHSLKRAALSVHNRLNSIAADAVFVSRVADAYSLPLIANERCGSWYIPPIRKSGSAYFKSTDGHTGQWAFSTRRLNLGVLEIIGKNDGCVIVDSTRRGKSMPDALSKTVPIWCAVLNKVLFPGISDSGNVQTPPGVVSPSEHNQIENKMMEFVESFQLLELDVKGLKEKVCKPLHPLWVTHDSTLPSLPPKFHNFHPVVLCTSSPKIVGGEISEGGYIQGAGDDSESWACGLTAPIFWKHRELLLTTPEEHLPSVITSLVRMSTVKITTSDIVAIKHAPWLFIGSDTCLDGLQAHDPGMVLHCAESRSKEAAEYLKGRYLFLNCRRGKLGSRDLRQQLLNTKALMDSLVQQPFSPKVFICCPTGNDLAVGVALAVLCLYSDSQGNRSVSPSSLIDKVYVRKRLSWIVSSREQANPSRATLQSVNAFLMSSG